jgi:hypothetical protein
MKRIYADGTICKGRHCQQTIINSKTDDTISSVNKLIYIKKGPLSVNKLNYIKKTEDTIRK